MALVKPIIAFRYPLKAIPWPKGRTYSWTACPVCKASWRPTPGSRLQCHSVCLFTSEALAAMRQSRLTLPELAAKYGVTPKIIAAAIGTGRRACS